MKIAFQATSTLYSTYHIGREETRGKVIWLYWFGSRSCPLSVNLSSTFTAAFQSQVTVTTVTRTNFPSRCLRHARSSQGETLSGDLTKKNPPRRIQP